MTTEPPKLATMIKAARERLGLSQSEAAEAWSVPLKTLQKWEQATRSPRGETLARLWPILFPEPKKRKPKA
ncbi:MAG: helix-turn-helix transcriptional regulator [Burkholderiales bacterium]|nr:helix-turn-helix transcriptional regulator [Opitutaceae bacterium]